MRSTATSVKRQQKESLYFKTISQLIAEVSRDDKELVDFFMTRIELSPDTGICTVLIYSPNGADHVHRVIGRLIFYKPSLRKSLATAIAGRRVPEIRFEYDSRFQKHERLEALLDSLAEKPLPKSSQESSE